MKKLEGDVLQLEKSQQKEEEEMMKLRQMNEWGKRKNIHEI